MFWISNIGKTNYSDAFDLQLSLRDARRQGQIENLLLLTSHPPVFTLGKRDCREDFLSPIPTIEAEGIEVIHSNRGGRVTYHGPGQIVGYFIVDLRSLHLGIPEFVRKIEELLILTLKTFGIDSHRDSEHPGVWKGEKKLGAIGLHFDRGVSIHGFALNVKPNLEHYRHIVACGIRGKSVSSMERELSRKIGTEEVEAILVEKLAEVFETEVREMDKKDLLDKSPQPPFFKGGHSKKLPPFEKGG